MMKDEEKWRATPIMFGAEVFIEPGQTIEEIDLWFRRLKEAGMKVTRIRLFENYMRKPDGTWDFTLFDEAYRAAERYDIKVYGNLFPATLFTDLGGLKFPRDKEHLGTIAKYVEKIVLHFKQFASCYGWVPVNEPGVGSFPREQFATDKYAEWKLEQAASGYTSGGYDRFDFADERFHLYYNTWFLQWLADEVHKYHPGSIIHVNNHAIFKNVAEYDFPSWRNFLTSLGGSAHASWHFGYFERRQYALAIAANCEILRSGAGDIPWFMTELQGGNNTYSGFLAMCPTAEEISQWLWLAMATESRGAIFWCLNPRSSGIEAGEWAMLNYHNEPSDRLIAAKGVIDVVEQNQRLFEQARVLTSGINVVYTRESLWIERTLQMNGKSYEGRDEGGVMRSCIAYFEALSEAGLQVNFKEISEFDFEQEDHTGTTLILAHQISIPSKYWQLLKSFVECGGTLIADGLTGYYDENAVATTRLGFPLRELFGADVLEYKAIDNMRMIDVDGVSLPAYMWTAILKTFTAEVIGEEHGLIAATKNLLARGTVYWLPSMFGLGGRMLNDYGPLIRFLKKALPGATNMPITFEAPHKGLIMKTLEHDRILVAVIVNNGTERQEFNLLISEPARQAMVLYANKGGKIGGTHITIDAGETMVIRWE